MKDNKFKLTFGEYEKEAGKTALYPGRNNLKGLNYAVLGLVGESGEIANKLKKILRGDYAISDIQHSLIAELGDVLWYVAAIAYELDVNLEDVAFKNLDKLAKRYENNTIQGEGDNR